MAEKRDLKVVAEKRGRMYLFFAVWHCFYKNKGHAHDQVRGHKELLEVSPIGASEADVETRRLELERRQLERIHIKFKELLERA